MNKAQIALQKIQQELKVPKTQFNKFGGFNYRNVSDILEAVKPLLAKYDALLVLDDEVFFCGECLFIKATATLTVEGEQISVHGYAWMAKSKKGMDEAQITGTASSYARKYALNGLFLIDDNADADSLTPAVPPAPAPSVNVFTGTIPPPPPPTR